MLWFLFMILFVYCRHCLHWVVLCMFIFFLTFFKNLHIYLNQDQRKLYKCFTTSFSLKAILAHLNLLPLTNKRFESKWVGLPCSVRAVCLRWLWSWLLIHPLSLTSGRAKTLPNQPGGATCCSDVLNKGAASSSYWHHIEPRVNKMH